MERGVCDGYERRLLQHLHEEERSRLGRYIGKALYYYAAYIFEQI